MANTMMAAGKPAKNNKNDNKKNKPEIAFETQFFGYDKEQVDRYVMNLRKAYQMAFNEYNIVIDKYNNIKDSGKLLEEQSGKVSMAGTVVDSLAGTEKMVQKILHDARVEFEQIKEDAILESRKIRFNANAEAAAVKVQAKKLLETAESRLSIANESAKKIISDARIEADKPRMEENGAMYEKRVQLKTAANEKQREQLDKPRIEHLSKPQSEQPDKRLNAQPNVLPEAPQSESQYTPSAEIRNESMKQMINKMRDALLTTDLG
jgi:cell division septum initiation protein DivIVA